GELSPCPPRRATASNDNDLCASINRELLGSTDCCSSNDRLPCDISDGQKELIQVEALISPGSVEVDDLSLPDTVVTDLDCDGASLQCSPDSSTCVQDQLSVSEEKPSLMEGNLESELQSQAPGSCTSSEPLSP
ncbi:hypothetical protein CIB84_017204, partial [Bambusicola thoracicus]